MTSGYDVQCPVCGTWNDVHADYYCEALGDSFDFMCECGAEFVVDFEFQPVFCVRGPT